MCDFNTLDDETKTRHHETLLAIAMQLGGKNAFLLFLEQFRRAKPHPLIAANCKFPTPQALLTWNKVIFKDKLDLFLKTRLNESKQANFLPAPTDKNYKNVLNLVKTLSPVIFYFEPKNVEAPTPFSVHAFDIVDAQTTRINPLFDALFFCSIETVKKVLNYEPKA